MGHPAVYVVDDDDGFRELVVLALEQHCKVQDVASFAGGAAALAALHAASPAHRPGLVLLDLHMPGMDGLAVLRALRRLDQPPGVVVISNAATPEERGRCESAGARFLPKPARFEALVAALQSVTGTKHNEDLE